MTAPRPQQVSPQPFRPLLAASRVESIRRQETGLILLNLTVLAGLAGLHVLFSPALGTPSRVFFAIVFGRFAMQMLELLGLNLLSSERAERLLPAYSHLSIWLNVTFAFLIAWLAQFEDSHYVALMVIPVIAASFRYSRPGIALVVAAAVTLTFLQVWLYFRPREVVHLSEYFEATNVMLIYIVVAVIVSFLARQVRSEQAALRRNLEELERTRDRLVEEEKLAAVGRLASAVAHEIRNPVSLIVSSLQLAREGRGSLSTDELQEIVSAEAARLEKLTSDFLLSARQRPPERQPTALADVVEYVESLARGRALEAGVELVVDCPGSATAEVDPFQLHQALLNLVLNAVEASGPGGRVTIAGSPLDGEDGSHGIRLTVENDGPPIPPEVAERIFEPFFTTKDRGTGLGLTIAKNVARSHGGDLVLVVNQPGAVRLAIDLPGCLVASAPAGPAATAPREP